MGRVPLINCTKIGAAARAPARSLSTSVPRMLTSHLKEIDPEMHKIIVNEAKRQRESIVLIPSENFTSQVRFISFL